MTPLGRSELIDVDLGKRLAHIEPQGLSERTTAGVDPQLGEGCGGSAGAPATASTERWQASSWS